MRPGRAKRGGQEIGRSRGGPSTKLHAIVDALGNPVRFALSPGQTHEMKHASELLANIENAYVVADSAYCAQSLVNELRGRGCNVVIANNPTHPRRSCDPDLYRERFLVENFFQRIKRLRRIAMRFEKLARNYLAFVYLAATLVWLASRRSLGRLPTSSVGSCMARVGWNQRQSLVSIATSRSSSSMPRA